MQVSFDQLEMCLARKCMSLSDLRAGVSAKTLLKIKRGGAVTPKTAGRIAKALNVDVEELVDFTAKEERT